MPDQNYDYLRSVISAQDQKLKVAHQQNAQLHVAVGSISTMASEYKTQLEKLAKILENVIDEQSIFFSEIQKTKELLSLPNHHPVNQILALNNRLHLMQKCVAGYQTQQEHQEAKIKDLQQKLSGF